MCFQSLPPITRTFPFVNLVRRFYKACRKREKWPQSEGAGQPLTRAAGQAAGQSIPDRPPWDGRVESQNHRHVWSSSSRSKPTARPRPAARAPCLLQELPPAPSSLPSGEYFLRFPFFAFPASFNLPPSVRRGPELRGTRPPHCHDGPRREQDDRARLACPGVPHAPLPVSEETVSVG